MPPATPLPTPTRTIDALAVVTLAACAVQGIADAVYRTGFFGVLSTGFAGLAAVVYLLRRSRGDRTWTATAFTVCALGGWVFASGLLGLPPVLVALLLVRLDHGTRSTYLAAVLIGVVAAINLASHGVGWSFVVSEMVGVVLLLYAGVWLAGIVAASYDNQHAAQVVSAERDRALTELRHSNAALSSANEALAASIETEKELVLAQERARAAAELHDGLGHRLTAIRLGLDFADRMWDKDGSAARAEVVRAREATGDALHEMRIWVRALAPGSHTGLTDTEAFDAIADSFRGTGLAVTVDAERLHGDLPPELSLFCHRFVQEGLTNAVRHGKASRVEIRLESTSQSVRITLQDNGTAPGTGQDDGSDRTGDRHSDQTGSDDERGGSDTTRPGVVEGFGLRSLRERAAALNGSLTAAHASDGFVLSAELVNR